MLDRDLANLYDIEIKVFNQAVKCNSKRFPSDFLFQLTKDEYENFSNSNAENNFPNPLRSQIVTLKDSAAGSIESIFLMLLPNKALRC